jgi:hypothetical protein
MVDKLVEVTLEKQDDFLKVRETLTRIGVFISPATSYTSKENITLFTSRNSLNWTASHPICQTTTFSVVTQLRI